MSHHRILYQIYADSQANTDDDSYRRADRYINGVKSRGDKNEAIAVAIKAAKNCRHPFVVLAIPIPKRLDSMCNAWIVDV